MALTLPIIANLKEVPVSNFKRCIICQISQKNLVNARLIKDSSYINLLTSLRERNDLRDTKYHTTYKRLEGEDQSSLKLKGATWHRNCYNQVTNREHIERVSEKAKCLNPEVEGTSNDEQASTSGIRITRSSLPSFSKEMCFFCQKRKSNDLLHEASSNNVSDKLRDVVHYLQDEVLLIRLASRGEDARAKDIKYHLSCWVRYVDRLDGKRDENFSRVAEATRGIEIELLDIITVSIEAGEVINIKQVLSMYQELMAKNDITDSRNEKAIKIWLKSLITTEIKNVEFQQPFRKNEPSLIVSKTFLPKALDIAIMHLDRASLESDNDSDILRKAAKIIRDDCIDFKYGNEIEFHGSIDISGTNVPPKTLEFFKYVIAGSKHLEGVRNDQILRTSITLTNNLLFSIKSDRQVSYSPKETSTSKSFRNSSKVHQAIGIGLAVRQNGRHKSIIDFLHGFGFSISNTQCLYWETALANSVLRNISNNGNLFIPHVLQKGQQIMFHVDNANFSEDTPDGKRITDALMMAGFQRKVGNENNIQKAFLNVDQHCRTQTLDSTEYNNLQYCAPPNDKNFLLPTGCKKYNQKHTNNHGNLTIDTNNVNIPWILGKYSDFLCLQPNFISIADEISISNTISPDDEESNIVLSDCHRNQNEGVSCPDRFSERIKDLELPSWSAYHSARQDLPNSLTQVVMFPLIPGPSQDYSSIYSALKLCQHISVWCSGNCSKTIVTLDLDLYSRALKLVQSRQEMRDKFLLRLGELHGVFAHSRAIGHFICDSGLDSMWTAADVFGTTVVNQVLNCSHMKRCLAAHELNMIVMYTFYLQAFEKDNPNTLTCGYLLDMIFKLRDAVAKSNKEDIQSTSVLITNHLASIDFEIKCFRFDEKRKGNKMFQFIMQYLKMYERLLTFIYASRSRNWELHLKAAENLSQDFCSMDRIKYRRLWPVYISNMYAIREIDPGTWNFLKEEFSVQKSPIPFTAIGADHAGEQVNKVLKVEGGITGISNNINARLKFFLTAPLLADLTNEMEKQLITGQKQRTKHHESGKAFAKRQDKMTQKLYNRMSAVSCIFETKYQPTMYNLVTNILLPEKYHTQLLKCDETGVKLNDVFIAERLGENPKESIWAPVHRANVKTFSITNKKTKTKNEQKVEMLQEQRGLFGRCIIIAQSDKDFDLKALIGNHELSGVVRSLMESDGSLIPGSTQKSKLIECVTVNVSSSTPPDTCDAYKVAIIDAMVIVQSIDIKKSKIVTCKDLAKIFIKNVVTKGQNCKEIRIVFDTYPIVSLKHATRKSRNRKHDPVEYRIDDTTQVRGTVNSFIAHEGTKRNLIPYLVEKTSVYLKEHSYQFLISAEGKTGGNIEFPENNNHEEADTLLIYHAIHASQNEEKTVCIFSPDTDVLAIACAYVDKLAKNTFIFLHLGVYRIADIAANIGYDNCRALIGLHAFTGSDVSGKFNGFGKHSWWKEFLLADKNIITAFLSLGKAEEVSEEIINSLARFVCDVYCGKRKQTRTIPETRWLIYCRNPGKSESLPPTLGALREHIRRANYVTYVWNSSHLAIQTLPQITDCGWEYDEREYIPVATSEELIPQNLLKSMKCTCSTGCGNRCSCTRRGRSCTGVCECVNCENTDYVPKINIGGDEDI